jgi:hypothetical protein
MSKGHFENKGFNVGMIVLSKVIRGREERKHESTPAWKACSILKVISWMIATTYRYLYQDRQNQDRYHDLSHTCSLCHYGVSINAGAVVLN